MVWIYQHFTVSVYQYGNFIWLAKTCIGKHDLHDHIYVPCIHGYITEHLLVPVTGS